jgi:hypothetical protein
MEWYRRRQIVGRSFAHDSTEDLVHVCIDMFMGNQGRQKPNVMFKIKFLSQHFEVIKMIKAMHDLQESDFG